MSKYHICGNNYSNICKNKNINHVLNLVHGFLKQNLDQLDAQHQIYTCPSV